MSFVKISFSVMRTRRNQARNTKEFPGPPGRANRVLKMKVDRGRFGGIARHVELACWFFLLCARSKYFIDFNVMGKKCVFDIVKAVFGVQINEFVGSKICVKKKELKICVLFKYLSYVCIMSKAITIKTETTVKELNPDILGKNPFIESLSIPVNKMMMTGQYKATKEVYADGKPIMLPVEIEIESETHCKIFNDARRRKMMVVLSKPGKELFLWLIYEIESGKDYVWVNKNRYLRENDIKSLNTYRTAINDLIFNGYIVKTLATDVYWINPALFFCGSRKNRFPKNVVRK